MTSPVDLPPDTPESLRQEIAECNQVAQRAELNGDQVMADFAHTQINQALEAHRNLGTT